ncbi:MAG: serine hydrolase domain-containing protein [Nitrosospira sp.]
MPSIFLACLLLAVTYAAQSKDTETLPAARTVDELQMQLETILGDTHTPGLSVAIVHGDGRKWTAGLGKADVSNNRSATPATLFRIGSVSKAFVSLSILKLVDEKKLSLMDPVRKWVPEVWFENQWEQDDPVRIVDLLEHTTGWDNMHLHEYAKDGSGLGLREALDYGRRSRVSRWPPGTRMAYNNSGPPVAAYIVEKLTGQRFEDSVAQNFFGPIGMKTATYFPAAPMVLTELYHLDGKTPYSYWNMLYRPSGSINASAEDMAAYLAFYLHRGTVNGVQVLALASIDRMETSTRTWAAQKGLRGGKGGYGLGSSVSIHDGFVYHGHSGAVDGGLTELAYLPDANVGYFYSINTANPDAAMRIGNAIRAYITRALQAPLLPTTAALPVNAHSYEGWYIPDSPSDKTGHFIERLGGMTHVRVEEGKLLIDSPLAGTELVLVPVDDMQFRQISEPIATAKLLAMDEDGKFIQLYGGMMTMKRILGWAALAEMMLAAWAVLALVSVLLYMPFWLLGCIRKNYFRPAELSILGFPLLAASSVVLMVGIGFVVSDSGDIRVLLGNLTIWSGGIFLATVMFALSTLASGVVLWRMPKQGIRKAVLWYSIGVIPAMMFATAYLGYWGVIGLRTWA